MTSREKMENILDFVRTTLSVDYGFIECLEQDLTSLVIIAQTEGVKKAREMLDKIWNKE